MESEKNWKRSLDTMKFEKNFNQIFFNLRISQDTEEVKMVTNLTNSTRYEQERWSWQRPLKDTQITIVIWVSLSGRCHDHLSCSYLVEFVKFVTILTSSVSCEILKLKKIWLKFFSNFIVSNDLFQFFSDSIWQFYSA